MFGRLIVRPWFWAIAIGALFALPLVRVFLKPAIKLPPVRGAVPAFQLVRETGAPFGSTELDGKVWVAARFTVDGERPAARAMVELERRMRKLGDAFELISIAPDSAPPALAEWARVHKTYPRRWALLTGAPAVIAPLVAALELDAPGGASDATLVLVDSHGRIRGRYDAGATKQESRDTMDQLIYDAALLVNNY